MAQANDISLRLSFIEKYKEDKALVGILLADTKDYKLKGKSILIACMKTCYRSRLSNEEMKKKVEILKVLTLEGEDSNRRDTSGYTALGWLV
jgi:hypothetical protein